MSKVAPGVSERREVRGASGKKILVVSRSGDRAVVPGGRESEEKRLSYCYYSDISFATLPVATPVDL